MSTQPEDTMVDVRVGGETDAAKVESETVTSNAASSTSTSTSKLQNIKNRIATTYTKIETNKQTGPYIGQFVAASVLLISLIVSPLRLAYHAYSISAAVIAMVFSMLGIYFYKKRNIGTRHLATLPLLGAVNLENANDMFIFIWWIFATVVLTFFGPFEETSNGFFAAWIGLYFAVVSSTNGKLNMERMKKATEGEQGYMNVALTASVVLICSLLKFLGSQFWGETVFAMVAGSLTIVIVAMISLTASAKSALKKYPVFDFLGVFWVISALLTTFRGPFLVTGNGYFAVWAGSVSCFMVSSVSKEIAEEGQGDIGEESKEDRQQ